MIDNRAASQAVQLTKKQAQAVYDAMFDCDAPNYDEGYEGAIGVLDEQSFAPDAERAAYSRNWLQRHCTKEQLAAIRMIAGVEV